MDEITLSVYLGLLGIDKAALEECGDVTLDLLLRAGVLVECENHAEYMTLPPSCEVDYKQLAKTCHVGYNHINGFILLLTELVGFPNTRREIVKMG